MCSSRSGFPNMFISSVMRQHSCLCLERMSPLMVGGSTFLLCCKEQQFSCSVRPEESRLRTGLFFSTLFLVTIEWSF